MTLDRYKELLPQIRTEIDKSDAPFSYFMHDNAWRDSQPRAELNEYIGEGLWTQYMGPPCWKPSKTRFTPIRKQPVREPKLRCSCTFPEGAVHAAYNPKMNMVEETFAAIDSAMLKNQRADAKQGKPLLEKGAGKETFWKKQLQKAVHQVNNQKHIFQNQYAGFKVRCQQLIKSRGKRLRTSKY